MKSFIRILRPALVSFAVLTLVCGVLYTLVVTGVAEVFFPRQANGSIVTVTMADGTKRDSGSALIAQEFTDQKYLVGRPSGTTNLSPTGVKERELVRSRVAQWHSLDPSNGAEIPADLVTASGSGVDPFISPAAAEYQVSRIARVRGIPESTVRTAIRRNTNGRFLAVFGDPAVNVLKVNLTLDGLLR